MVSFYSSIALLVVPVLIAIVLMTDGSSRWATCLIPGHDSTFCEVDRRSNLSVADFVREYDGKRPVIITDATQHWPAMKWNSKFFAHHFEDQKVFAKAVEGTLETAQILPMSIDKFSEISHLGRADQWKYIEDELFIQTHPKLKDDLLHLDYLEEDFFQFLPIDVRPWNSMLLWGTPYSRSSLHIDPYNWTGTNAVFYGKKIWKLFPPGQDDYLYIKDNVRCHFPLECFKYNSPIDAFDPDYDKYPLFKKAKSITCTQSAGELLVIPSGWFHQALNPEETIAVSSQVMNSQNYKIVLEEILKAGEIDRDSLPLDFSEFPSSKQVQTLASLIPTKVLLKGKKVTEKVLKQLT